MRWIAMLAALLAACGGGDEEGERHPALGRCFTPPREIVGDGYSGGSLCVPEDWEFGSACMRVRSTVECDDPKLQPMFCVGVRDTAGIGEGETFGLCYSSSPDCIADAIDNPPCCVDFYATHSPGASGDCE